MTVDWLIGIPSQNLPKHISWISHMVEPTVRAYKWLLQGVQSSLLPPMNCVNGLPGELYCTKCLLDVSTLHSSIWVQHGFGYTIGLFWMYYANIEPNEQVSILLTKTWGRILIGQVYLEATLWRITAAFVHCWNVLIWVDYFMVHFDSNFVVADRKSVV